MTDHNCGSSACAQAHDLYRDDRIAYFDYYWEVCLRLRKRLRHPAQGPIAVT